MRAETLARAIRDIAALLLDAIWRKIRYGESINNRLAFEELKNQQILKMLEEVEKCRRP